MYWSGKDGWMDSEKNISKMKALRGLLQMQISFLYGPLPQIADKVREIVWIKGKG